MAIVYAELKEFAERSGSHPRASCAKTSSRSHQILSRDRQDSRARSREALRRQAQRRRTRAEPESSVVVYTNDKDTKAFLEREAQRLAPGLKRKSGVRYGSIVGGEKSTHKGRQLTYGDLVIEYIRLNQDQGAIRPDPPREIHQLHK